MKLKVLSIGVLTIVAVSVLSISAYAVFSKKDRLEQLQTDYKDKQIKMADEISAMPKNSAADLKKIAEAERKLKDMPTSLEADKLMSESPLVDSKQQARKDLETRIFYRKDTLNEQQSNKVIEQLKLQLSQIEKDLTEGKVSIEELNKRLDSIVIR